MVAAAASSSPILAPFDEILLKKEGYNKYIQEVFFFD
jgi:hypothetical protein